MPKALLLATLLLAATTGAAAQTISDAPAFDDLVARAGSIVLTEVLETRSRWRQLQNKRVIVTEVRLRVEKSIKGSTDGVMTITLLGGTVGDVTQHVAGTPRFMTGDSDVLFLSPTRTLVSPLVGRSRGRFRIVTGHGGAGRYVANSALQPLVNTTDYARPRRLASGERALALDEFIAAIAARLAR
jgi:hypothetical protein